MLISYQMRLSAPSLTVKTRRILNILIAMSTVVVIAPFLFNFAGDAQVHLVVAERFWLGDPFQYNPGGETVIASTSPFWTILLTLFYTLIGYVAPLLLKITVVLIWAITSWLLYHVAHDIWGMSGYQLYGLMALWLTSTAIAANALSGLENILSAMQLLWIYYAVVCIVRRPLSWRQGISLGLLLGWMILTRPDGGALGGLVLLGLFVIRRLAYRAPLRELIYNAGLILIVALLVLMPWYIYQYHLTGKLVTDSSLARLYVGRRNAIVLVSGLLYFYPKSLVTLVTAFAPFCVGLIVTVVILIKRACRTVPTSTVESLSRNVQPHVAMALMLILAGLSFYSVVLGADQFGRYFLPIFPFFFLCGVAGIAQIIRRLNRVWLKSALVLITVAYAVFASGIDYYRRIALGQNFDFNLVTLMAAPMNRRANTDALLESLGVPNAQQIKFAVTEVQYRYFFDDRVVILSLDGRSSDKILSYWSADRIYPDFEGYFEAERPDFVQLGQWCSDAGLGWLGGLVRPPERETNLVCEWDKQVAQGQVGETLDWRVNSVQLKLPRAQAATRFGEDKTLLLEKTGPIVELRWD